MPLKALFLVSLFLLQNIDRGPVLVRTASINILSKNIKNIFFPKTFSMLTAEKFSVYCMGKFS